MVWFQAAPPHVPLLKLHHANVALATLKAPTASELYGAITTHPSSTAPPENRADPLRPDPDASTTRKDGAPVAAEGSKMPTTPAE